MLQIINDDRLNFLGVRTNIDMLNYRYFTSNICTSLYINPNTSAYNIFSSNIIKYFNIVKIIYSLINTKKLYCNSTIHIINNKKLNFIISLPKIEINNNYIINDGKALELNRDNIIKVIDKCKSTNNRYFTKFSSINDAIVDGTYYNGDKIYHVEIGDILHIDDNGIITWDECKGNPFFSFKINMSDYIIVTDGFRYAKLSNNNIVRCDGILDTTIQNIFISLINNSCFN